MSRMIKFIASAAVMAVLLVGPRTAIADGTIVYDSILSNTGSFFRTGFNMADDVHLDAVKSITGFDIRFSSAPGGTLHVRVWENDPLNSSFPFLDPSKGPPGQPALLADVTVTGLSGNSIAHVDLPVPIEAADIWVGLESGIISTSLSYVALDIGSTFNGGSSIDQLLNLHFSGAFQTFGSFGSGNQIGICCNPSGASLLGSLAMRVYGVDIAPAVTPVDIDIKPGSFPNSINQGSGGVIPVAILGSETFDATAVDGSTCTLGEAAVKIVGRSDKLLCSVEDVNDDGFLDQVCKFVTIDLGAEVGDTEASIFCSAPEEIEGTDSIRLVPPE